MRPVQKECKKRKLGFAREPGRTKWLSWVSYSHDCLNYSHCLPILISLFLEQTFAMLEGYQNGKGLAMRGLFFFFFTEVQ